MPVSVTAHRSPARLLRRQLHDMLQPASLSRFDHGFVLPSVCRHEKDSIDASEGDLQCFRPVEISDRPFDAGIEMGRLRRIPVRMRQLFPLASNSATMFPPIVPVAPVTRIIRFSLRKKSPGRRLTPGTYGC